MRSRNARTKTSHRTSQPPGQSSQLGDGLPHVALVAATRRDRLSAVEQHLVAAARLPVNRPDARHVHEVRATDAHEPRFAHFVAQLRHRPSDEVVRRPREHAQVISLDRDSADVADVDVYRQAVAALRGAER